MLKALKQIALEEETHIYLLIEEAIQMLLDNRENGSKYGSGKQK